MDEIELAELSDEDFPMPNEDQLKALRDYKRSHGDNWIIHLNMDWASGADMQRPYGSLLRQIRNTFGPAWVIEAHKRGRI